MREQRGSEQRRDDRRAADAARENGRRGVGRLGLGKGGASGRAYICPAPNERIQRLGAAIQWSGGAGAGGWALVGRAAIGPAHNCAVLRAGTMGLGSGPSTMSLSGRAGPRHYEPGLGPPIVPSPFGNL